MFGRGGATSDAEGIEMLSTRWSDDSPWGVTDPPDLSDATGSGDEDRDAASNRRRWIIGSAILAVVVLAVVTVTVFGKNDDTIIVAPPTTRATSDPVAPTGASTTLPAILVDTPSGDDPFALAPGSPLGYIVDDLPANLTQISAHTYPNEAGGNSQDGDLQLWASPDATRTTGTWFVAQTHRMDDSPWSAPMGRRIPIGDTIGALVTARDGVFELRFSTTTTDGLPASVAVASFGLPEETVVQLAASIVIDDDGLFAIATMPSTMTNLIHSRSMPFGVLSGPASLAYSGTVTITDYANPEMDDASSVLQIAAAEISVDVAALLPFLLLEGQQEDVEGRTVWIGHDPSLTWVQRPSTRSIAMFVAGERIVVMESELAADELRAAIGSVRLASAEMWGGLLLDTLRRDRSTVHPASGTAGQTTIIANDETGGREAVGTWSVSVDQGGIDMLVLETGSGGYGFQLPDGPMIVTTLSPQNIVVAGIGVAGSGPWTLRLTIAGVVAQEVGSATSAHDIPVAALAFDDLGPYVIDLIDASGAVMASASG